MRHALFGTDNSVVPFLLRLTLAIVMFPHGAQKVLGWFGGQGLDATMQAMTTHMGIPAPFAALAIAAEFLGPIGLIVGLLTRVAAFGIAVEMLVAVAKVHEPNGFFMNWSGHERGEGFEFHILMIGIAVALMVSGGGRWSVDHAIAPLGIRPDRGVREL